MDNAAHTEQITVCGPLLRVFLCLLPRLSSQSLPLNQVQERTNCVKTRNYIEIVNKKHNQSVFKMYLCDNHDVIINGEVVYSSGDMRSKAIAKQVNKLQELLQLKERQCSV